MALNICHLLVYFLMRFVLVASSFNQIRFSYVIREGNKVVYNLVKFVINDLNFFV